jgi:hypothetical protein
MEYGMNKALGTVRQKELETERAVS